MTQPKYIIFDLEIVKAIPPKDPADRIERIQYCDGWRDFDNMGISTISLASGVGDDYGKSWDFEIHGQNTVIPLLKFLRLEGYKIGGFNSRKFDDHLLTANGIPFKSDFDLLEMVLESAGLKGVNYWNQKPKRSYSLDTITAANGMTKTGHGTMAPIWWQQGDKQRVLDYCRNDAVIEMGVLKLILAGELVDPNDGKLLKWSEK